VTGLNAPQIGLGIEAARFGYKYQHVYLPKKEQERQRYKQRENTKLITDTENTVINIKPIANVR